MLFHDGRICEDVPVYILKYTNAVSYKIQKDGDCYLI